MSFDQGLSSSMETMMSQQLGRTTMGGGKMNAMVATSGTFDGAGPMSTMNGRRMGIADERKAEYEQSYRSPLDINMQMTSAMRGDESPFAGGPFSGGPSYGSPEFGAPAASGHEYGTPDMGGPNISGPAYGSPDMRGPDTGGSMLPAGRMDGPGASGPDYGPPAMHSPNMGGPNISGPMMPGGPDMSGPMVQGGPEMMSPDMTSPDMMGGMQRQEGPMVQKAAAAHGTGGMMPMNPQVVVMQRQTGPEVQKAQSGGDAPQSLITGDAPARKSKAEEEDEDEKRIEPLPMMQAVACASMIRPTELPDDVPDDTVADPEKEASKEELLERKLRKFSNDELADLAERFVGEAQAAADKEDYLLASAKLEIVGMEVERRVEEGIMDATASHT